MKQKNIRMLENLSLFCHVGGIINVFLGILIAAMNFSNNQLGHVQSGIFIFLTGYALVKISTKLSYIIWDENRDRHLKL